MCSHQEKWLPAMHAISSTQESMNHTVNSGFALLILFCVFLCSQSHDAPKSITIFQGARLKVGPKV